MGFALAPTTTGMPAKTSTAPSSTCPMICQSHESAEYRLTVQLGARVCARSTRAAMCVRCPIAANVEHSSSARREGRILGGYNRRLARPAAKPKSAVPFDALRSMRGIAHTSPALADKPPSLSPLKHGRPGGRAEARRWPTVRPQRRLCSAARLSGERRAARAPTGQR